MRDNSKLRVSGPSAPGMDPARRGVRLQEGWFHALAHRTCLRRNDGGGWGRLVEVVQPGGVAAGYFCLFVFGHAGQYLVQDLPRLGERRLSVRVV